MSRLKKVGLVIVALIVLAYLIWRCASPDDEDYSNSWKNQEQRYSSVII